jgi:hypothetical protein
MDIVVNTAVDCFVLRICRWIMWSLVALVGSLHGRWFPFNDLIVMPSVSPHEESYLSLFHSLTLSSLQLNRENTVTSCRKCNGRKGCLRPTEIHHIGMTLKSKPRCPSLYELAAEANKFVPRRVHPTWAPFLGIDEDDDEEEGEKSSTSTSFGGNTWSSGSCLPRP